MPAAVIGAIGTAAGWTAATIATVTTITQVVLFVGGLALSAHQRSQAKKKARESYNAAQVDRLANVVTTVAPRELVLGRTRKGGAIYFRGSAGELKDTFVAHLSLAGHEIDAVEQVYLNDQAVTVDAEGRVLDEPYHRVIRASFRETVPAGSTSITLERDPIEGTISLGISLTFAGAYQDIIYPAFTVAGRVVTFSEPAPAIIQVRYQADAHFYYAKVWWELGSATALADARTKTLFPELWTDNHRAQGVAKLIAEFTYNETAFPSGVPALTARIRGAKVYDPRTATTAWSENPALLARHIYSHPYFGKATVSAAEDARFIAAANACDTPQIYTLSNGSSVSTQLYRAALVVPYGAPARGALDDLCQAMAGMCAFAGGELHIRAGVYTAPVMTLTDADLAVVQRTGDGEQQDAINICAHRERAEKFNVVNLRIWDAEQAYKQVALSPLKSTALITRDGEELAQELQLSGVFFAAQALHVAGVAMRDARDPLTFEAPWKLRAYPLELFDTVQVTLARYGWTNKTFMILSRVWDREKGVVRLSMKETAAAIYTPDATFEAQGYAQNTALPNPLGIEPPELQAVNVFSGSDELVALAGGGLLTRVRVTWPALNHAAVTSDGEIEVQWVGIAGDIWESVRVPGDSTQAYLVGPADGQAIVIRARSRNSLAVSDWSLQVTHVVLGKTEPPTAPTQVTTTGDLVLITGGNEDLDFAGYRILRNAGTSTERSVASPLHTGLVQVSPWQMPVRPYGVNTIIVVSVDTSGNESEPVWDTRDFGAPELANVADEVDFEAEGFPGLYTNCAVYDGDVVADPDPVSDSFWGGAESSSFWYRDGAADFWSPSLYLAMEYVVTYAAPYDGGVMYLDVLAEGARVVTEYRVGGDAAGDFWNDPDRAEFWSAPVDLDSFWGAESPWQLWPSSLAPTVAGVGYQFRVSIDAGGVRGRIYTMSARVEMPELDTSFGSLAIAAAGTFIDPTAGSPARTFILISDVQVTPIVDGSGAVAGRVKSYPINPSTGPEVELINSAGAAVSGNAFVRIKGS